MLCPECKEETREGNEESGSSSIFKLLLTLLSLGSAVIAFLVVSQKCGLKKNSDTDSASEKSKQVTRKAPVKSKKKNVKKDVDALTQRQRRVLTSLRRKGSITVGELVKNMKNVSERTLRRDMNKLASLGFCKKQGSTKGTKYILKG